MRPAAAALLLAAVLGCNQYPESYPPPEQRTPPAPEETGDAKMFVAMNDPDAESYFIRDIRGLEAGQWRWTGPNPTLHFVLDRADGLKFVMDFSIAGATFETTGPVTLTFEINGRRLDSVRYDSYGRKHYEKEVPAGWIEPGADTIVSIRIDPVWVAPQTGTKLGIILQRAGFVPVDAP